MFPKPSRRSRGLYDWGAFTLSCLSNYYCDGSHRWPVVTLIFRMPHKPGRGRKVPYVTCHRLSVPLPYLRFRTAYKYRRLGALRVTRAFDKSYRAIFR